MPMAFLMGVDWQDCFKVSQTSVKGISYSIFSTISLNLALLQLGTIIWATYDLVTIKCLFGYIINLRLSA